MGAYYIIDFDSTFIQREALDILCEISLQGNHNQQEIVNKVEQITQAGMNGQINFRESLEQRLALFSASRQHVQELIKQLKTIVTESIQRNKRFFKTHHDQIFIVSNGFKDFIDPVVAEYGIPRDQVLANEFLYNEEGEIIGFNQNNVLSQEKGKPKAVAELDLHGTVVAIGDGMTDYQIKEAGEADYFFAFTENISRKMVVEVADYIAPTFDEVLYIMNQENRALSYPKNRIKILLLENIHPIAQQLFAKEGYQVEVLPTALSEEELCEKIKDVSFLGIRSKTQVTKKVLNHAPKLLSIGAFCIGTNQIDLKACTSKGIHVINAPFSNTRSVVELAIGEMILLIRNLPDSMMLMHKGKWNKSAKHSHEIRGKSLGIIGYGSIGSQLSVLAESLGMNVYYYDVMDRLALGNATQCETLEELLCQSDIISIHVDGREENKELIGSKEFEQMKDGVVLVNLSRGHVVNLEALKEAIDSGKVHGAGIDVFPQEPKNNDEEFISSIRNSRNTILTPHIGGSTEEAQENIGRYVPKKAIEFINNGSTSNGVNLPEVQLPVLKEAHRFLHIHHNQSGVMAKINQLLANHEINITGQYLKTNETVGYVITDVSKDHSPEIIKKLKQIDGTIRFRKLF